MRRTSREPVEFVGFIEFVGFVEFTKQKERHIKQSSLPDRGRELKGGGEGSVGFVEFVEFVELKTYSAVKKR